MTRQERLIEMIGVLNIFTGYLKELGHDTAMLNGSKGELIADYLIESYVPAQKKNQDYDGLAIINGEHSKISVKCSTYAKTPKGNNEVLITNKHNYDYLFILLEDTPYLIPKLEIKLRCKPKSKTKDRFVYTKGNLDFLKEYKLEKE